jgi:hypothetical protein
MKRERQFMTQETFDQTLSWFERFQTKFISLHNFGDPLLHPELISYVKKAAEVVPQVQLSTNGLLLNPEVLWDLKQAGLTHLKISLHHKESMQWIPFAKRAGFILSVTGDFNHDWAGQVENDNANENRVDRTKPCGYLKHNYGTVLCDGRVATCCFDVEGRNTFGTVFDDLAPFVVVPIDLCARCDIVRAA